MPQRLFVTCLCLLAGTFIPATRAAAANGLTLTVNTIADPDNMVGQCATGGPCSLREAVNQADADSGDTIVVLAGTYDIDSTLGAITLQSPMTITGAGAPATIVDGQGMSGILHLVSGAAVSLTGMTLQNGRTMGSGAAALVDSGSSLTLSDCTLTDNRAAGSGGAIEDQGSVTVQDCVLVANGASTVGGAIDATSATNPMLSVSDSTIAGNSGMAAGGGLALSHSASPMTVDGDTVDGNFSHSGANVSVATGSPVASPQFENTIVADGLGPAATNCDAPVVSLGHNLEDGTSCGFTAPGDLSGVDSGLGPLQDNGGPTETMALLPGSPAIDAGSGQCDASDQRGVSRPQGLVCDIGAYEVAPPAGGSASTLALSSSAATIVVSAANPDVQAGSVSLQYGATTDYGSTTSAQTLPAVTPPAGYTFTISGLASGQTYHVRAVAENPDGIVDGPDLTFTTVPAPATPSAPAAPPAPVALTRPATAIGATVATLHALVDTGGAEASVTFQYGTSPTLAGARSTPAHTVSATTAQAQVSATVAGLIPGRTYYFRAVATSAPVAVRAVGTIARFTTLKRVTAKVTFASEASSERATKVTRLRIPQAPVGATVTVRCAGAGRSCPYAERTVLVRAPKTKCAAGKCTPKKAPSTVSMDLAGPFRNRALPFGAAVTVRITEAGFVGEAYVFTMARHVHPASGCLAPGATRPSTIC
jgi:hypothetical protein